MQALTLTNQLTTFLFIIIFNFGLKFDSKVFKSKLTYRIF